jgi:hypothetical protein
VQRGDLRRESVEETAVSFPAFLRLLFSNPQSSTPNPMETHQEPESSPLVQGEESGSLLLLSGSSSPTVGTALDVNVHTVEQQIARATDNSTEEKKSSLEQGSMAEEPSPSKVEHQPSPSGAGTGKEVAATAGVKDEQDDEIEEDEKEHEVVAWWALSDMLLRQRPCNPRTASLPLLLLLSQVGFP